MEGGAWPNLADSGWGKCFLVLDFECPHTVRHKIGLGHSICYVGTKGLEEGTPCITRTVKGTMGSSGGGGSRAGWPMGMTLVSPQNSEE